MPKVSVLVPIYNVEKYLRQCLESLVTQTLKDIEIICINDGSTDGSLEIVKQYATNDPRIVIIDKANSGYGDSMNRGLEKATGEYIGIVESDDWAEADMFEALFDLAEKNHAEVVKSNYYNYYTSPQKKALNDTITYLVDPHQCGRLVTPLDEPHIMLQRPAIWTGLYSREFLKKNDIKFVPSPGASYQDTGFSFKVWASTSKVVFTTSAFLHYRQDNEASSVNNPGKVFCVADEFVDVKEYLQNHKLWDTAKEIFCLARWGAYAWNIQRLAPALASEFINYARQQFLEEESNGELALRIFDANQLRGLNEVIANPERAAARRECQDKAVVSVIVPVHNAGKYLRPCLDSICKQTIKDLDILLIDDGSTDESIEIVEEYFQADPRIRLTSQFNRGQSVARNVGIEQAEADWIMFIDSDDYFEENSVELLLGAVTSNKSNLAIGSIRPIFETGTRSAMERVQDEQYYKVRFSGTHQISPDIIEKIDVSPCNKIFNRELLDDNNLRFPEDLKYEDAYFVNAYCWISKTMTFLPVESFVYNYRRRPGSTMDQTFHGASFVRDHMEIGFRLLDFLTNSRSTRKYGAYYMNLLLNYIRLTIRFAPAYQLKEIWGRLARWVSFHHEVLASLDLAVLKQIILMIPDPYKHEFVGSGIQSFTQRVENKLRRMTKKLLWDVIPSYRAASTVIRHLDNVSAQLGNNTYGIMVTLNRQTHTLEDIVTVLNASSPGKNKGSADD